MPAQPPTLTEPWVGLLSEYGVGLIVVLSVGFVVAALRCWRTRVSSAAKVQVMGDAAQQLRDSVTTLARAEAHRGEAIRILAHDIRSPIAATRLLAQSMAKEPSEQARLDLLRYLEIAAESSNELLEDLMDMSRSEPATSLLQSTVTDCVQQTQSLVNLYRLFAEPKRIKIHFEVPEGSYLVDISERSLQRALNNLLSNAVKFSNFDSEVWVSIQGTKEHVTWSVRDQGPGLTEQDLQDVLKRPGRLSARPTAEESTSGIGLYGTAKLLKANRATIRAKNTQAGTEFAIRFLRATTEAESIVRQSYGAAPSQPSEAAAKASETP